MGVLTTFVLREVLFTLVFLLVDVRAELERIKVLFLGVVWVTLDLLVWLTIAVLFLDWVWMLLVFEFLGTVLFIVRAAVLEVFVLFCLMLNDSKLFDIPKFCPILFWLKHSHETFETLIEHSHSTGFRLCVMLQHLPNPKRVLCLDLSLILGNLLHKFPKDSGHLL